MRIQTGRRAPAGAYDGLIAQAEAELARRQARELKERADEIREECRSLSGFIRHAWAVIEPNTPYVHGWHIDAMAEHLEAVSRGEIIRLLMTVPPGMMKSLITGVFFPAHEWGPGGRPGLRILGSSYNENYAIRDAGRMRSLISSEWFQTLWPITLTKQGERKFENDKTGWREGVPFSRLTGGRGDRVVIDDPHSTETAESPAERARTTRIFLESVPSRVNDPRTSAIIVIMQRLHELDVAGLIVSKELGYEHLMLPMKFEAARRCRTGIGFVDPREDEGELIFPARFPREVVERDESAMGPYAVAGQHQQRPTPRAGALFKPAMIQLVDAIPALISKRTRAWDFAASRPLPGTDPDYTAGVRIARCDQGFFWIEHVLRDRGDSAAVKAWVKGTASQDTTATRIRIPQDPGQAGKAQAEDYVRELAGYMVETKPISGDKEVRATPLASQVNAGNVRMLRGPWNQALIDELTVFPAGAHDDQVDAAADAFNDVAGTAGGEGVMEFYRQEAARQARADAPASVDRDSLVPMGGNGGTAYGLSGRRYDPDIDGVYWIEPADAAPLARAGFERRPTKAAADAERFAPYLQYLDNTGRRPLPVEMFDEDWEPAGPTVRADMVKAGVALEVHSVGGTGILRA